MVSSTPAFATSYDTPLNEEAGVYEAVPETSLSDTPSRRRLDVLERAKRLRNTTREYDRASRRRLQYPRSDLVPMLRRRATREQASTRRSTRLRRFIRQSRVAPGYPIEAGGQVARRRMKLRERERADIVQRRFIYRLRGIRGPAELLEAQRVCNENTGEPFSKCVRRVLEIQEQEEIVGRHKLYHEPNPTSGEEVVEDAMMVDTETETVEE